MMGSGDLKVVRVKVPSRYIREGVVVEDTADFKLGMGRCGKFVTNLFVKWTVPSLIIVQVCSDASVKRFVYPKEQLTGRVEEEYSYNGKTPSGPEVLKALEGSLPQRA